MAREGECAELHGLCSCSGCKKNGGETGGEDGVETCGHEEASGEVMFLVKRELRGCRPRIFAGTIKARVVGRGVDGCEIGELSRACVPRVLEGSAGAAGEDVKEVDDVLVFGEDAVLVEVDGVH